MNMALNSLFTNKKFLRLARNLGISEPTTLGHLEYLWHTTYANGNPDVGDYVDIEVAAKWDGEPDAFAEELESLGFIEEIEDTGEYEIHDWEDHIPPYVRKKVARREPKAGQRETNGRPMGDQGADSGRVEGKGMELNGKEGNGKYPKKSTKRKILANPEYSEQFIKFWELYPRKDDKKNAYEVWCAGDLDSKIGLAISKIKVYANDVKDSEKKWIKLPSSWLNAQDWNDIEPEQSSPPPRERKKETPAETEARLNALVPRLDKQGNIEYVSPDNL